MPAVSYRTAGEQITAAQMNELFAELDRKTALALDDHSLLYLIGEDCATTLRALDPYLGPRFIWRNGTDNISGYFSLSSSGVAPNPSRTFVSGTRAWSYDHSLFTAAAASAVPFTHDGFPVENIALKVLHINPLGNTYWAQRGRQQNSSDPSLFDHSLEAHRIDYVPASTPTAAPEKYWIGETRQISNTVWVRQSYERIRSWEQAELICEGVTELAFSSTWNKYNFFRLHNINADPFTLTFKKADDTPADITLLDGTTATSLTIPPHSSKCVRRALASGSYVSNPVYAYTEGYKYFQKFMPGDPRFYQQGGHQSEGSNNVFNPSLLIPFVNQLLAGTPVTPYAVSLYGPPTVLLDPHVRAPLPAGYEDKFGDPADDETIIGDLLHNKGAIRVQPDTDSGPSTSFTWPGYSEPLPAEMVSRVVGAEMEVKCSGPDAYLLAIGTNLLYGFSNFLGNALGLPDGYTRLPRNVPAAGFYKSFALVNGTALTLTFNAVNADGSLGAASTVSATPQSLAGSVQHSFSNIVTWRDRVSAGLATVDGSAHSSFTSTSFVLTSSGLAFNTTQTIPLTSPLTYARDALGAFVSTADNYLFKNLSMPCIRVLSPTLNASDSPTLYANPVRTLIEVDGTGLVIKRSVVFTNYGWPDVDNWTFTGFFCPREPRTYTDRADSPTVKTPHPDFTQGIENLTGEEIVYREDVGFIPTEIKILSPWNAANYIPTPSVPANDYDSGRHQFIGILSDHYQENSDLYQRLYGGNSTGLFVRMAMIVEMFNNMAAKVNSMARYQPLNFLDHAIFKTGLLQLTRQRFFHGNERGIWTHGGLQGIYSENFALYQMQQYTGLRPSDQYCSFGPKQNEVVAPNDYIDLVTAQCTALGITIRTESDFPQWTRIATKRLNVGFDVALGATQLAIASDNIIRTDVFDPHNPGYFWLVQRIHELTFAETPPVAMSASFAESTVSARPDLAALSGYKWVKTSDIKTVAESLGYKFVHAQFGVRFDLEIVEAAYLNFSALSGPSPSGGAIVDHAPGTVAVADSWYTNYLATPGVAGPPPPAENYPPMPPGTAVRVLSAEIAGGLSARFVEFLPAVGGEWIAGCDQIGGGPRDRRISVNLQPLSSFDFGYSAQVRFVCDIVPVNWVGGHLGSVPADFHEPDSAAATGFGGLQIIATARVTAELTDDRLRKVSWAKESAVNVIAMRNPADYASTGIGSDPQETFLVTEEQPMLVVTKSDTMPNNSTILRSPVPSFDFDVSAVTEAAFVRYGPVIIPCSTNPAGAHRVQALADFTAAY